MMTVGETVALIAARLQPLAGIEAVPLAEADGRILAADLVAPMPLPPFANSAVDGYAIRSADLPQEGERRFSVSGRVQAGSRSNEDVQSGEAARIFTGAPVPAGADTVFMQEDVRVERCCCLPV